MRVFVVCMLVLCLFVGTGTPTSAKKIDGTPNISARHAVLYEPSTDSFLYEKDSISRAPMASTTKIMTAYLAVKYCDLDSVINIPGEACGIEGSSLYLKEGEKYTIRDLLYGVLLQSANDAAAALAIFMDGNISTFADRMNAECEALGLVNTHFVNPHGLDDPDHFTSARDLAKLAAAALEYPAFADAVATRKYTISCENGDKRLLVNHNKLLHLYQGASGVKTGFTKKSGRCLVGAAEIDGVRLITVTLNAPDDWNDHIRLFEYGLSIVERKILCSAEDLIVNIPSFNEPGKYLSCTNSEELSAVLPKGSPAPTLQYEITPYIPTPKPTGAIVGYVKCILDGVCIAQSPLTIKEIHNLEVFYGKD